jgi:hypothetical protein
MRYDIQLDDNLPSILVNEVATIFSRARFIDDNFFGSKGNYEGQ